MNKQEFIDKWEKDLEMWKRACSENAIVHTRDERLKASAYVLSISSMLSDFKSLDEPFVSSKERHKDRTQLIKDNWEMFEMIYKGTLDHNSFSVKTFVRKLQDAGEYSHKTAPMDIIHTLKYKFIKLKEQGHVKTGN